MTRAGPKAGFSIAIAAALAGAGALTGPSAALAQDAPISTAADAVDGGAPMAGPFGAPPLRLDNGPGMGPGFLRAPVGPCGGPAKTEDGKTDKTPHGEVWAGVGTHGYREGGGVVCVPLSDRAAVTIAVDAGQMDGWGRRR
jgi:hypothetical protein